MSSVFRAAGSPCMPQQRTDIYLLPAVPMGAAEGTCLAKLRHGELLEIKRIMGHPRRAGTLGNGVSQRSLTGIQRDQRNTPSAGCGFSDRTDRVGAEFGGQVCGQRHMESGFCHQIAPEVRARGHKRRNHARPVSGSRPITRSHLKANVPRPSRRWCASGNSGRNQNMHYGRFLQSSDGQQVFALNTRLADAP